MNEKEAREIVVSKLEEGKKVGIISPYDTDYYGAKRYLEAIEKAKGLEEALDILPLFDILFSLEDLDDKQMRMVNESYEKRKEALAKWGRDK